VDLSLSLVLPVHNAQHCLPSVVSHLLDLLPDLTEDFELIVIDNGSTDQTEEVLHELARDYPQIRVLRHGQRSDAPGILKTAMEVSHGEVVFVQEENSTASAAEMRRLWRMRNDRQLIIARAECAQRPLSPHLMDRLTAWGNQLQQAAADEEGTGIQMIRREAVQQLDGPKNRSAGVRVVQSSRPRYRVWKT